MAKVGFVHAHNNLVPEYWRNDANKRYSKTLKHLAKLTKQRFKKNLPLATKKEMNSFIEWYFFDKSKSKGDKAYHILGWLFFNGFIILPIVFYLSGR